MAPNTTSYWDGEIASFLAGARERHALRMAVLAALRRNTGLTEAQRLRFLSMNAISGNRARLDSMRLRWLRSNRAKFAARAQVGVAA